MIEARPVCFPFDLLFFCFLTRNFDLKMLNKEISKVFFPKTLNQEDFLEKRFGSSIQNTPFKVQFRVLEIQIEQKGNHFETVFFVKTF